MKRNIFLITIDALRADYLYERDCRLHPFLSSLLGRSLIFENAISPSSHTAPSFKSLFTPLSSLERYSNYNIEKDIPYLPEILKKNGYYTAGFSPNANLTRIQGYKRGYDTFIDGLNGDSDKGEDKCIVQDAVSSLKDTFPDFITHENPYWRKFEGVFTDYVGYSEEVDRAKSFLKEYNEKKPLFMWTHFMEVHSPYRIAPKWFKMLGHKYIPRWEMEDLRQKRHRAGEVGKGITKDDIEKIKVLYECAIRWVDDKIRELFRVIKKEGLLEDSIIIITADHGEALGAEGNIGHPEELIDELLEIPFFIFGKGVKGECKKTIGLSNLYSIIDNLSEERTVKNVVGDLPDYALSEVERDGEKLFCIIKNGNKIIYNYTQDKISVERRSNETSEEEFNELKKILLLHVDEVVKSWADETLQDAVEKADLKI